MTPQSGAMRVLLKIPGIQVIDFYWYEDWLKYFGIINKPSTIPPSVKAFNGGVAKRLCSGLQSRLDGFDSRPRLQFYRSESKKIAHYAVGYFFCLVFSFLCACIAQHP